MIQGFGGGFWGVDAVGGAFDSGRYNGPFWPQPISNAVSNSPMNSILG